MIEQRLQDLKRFYSILDLLKEQTGLRNLGSCNGKMPWPSRGVYFFFEPGEARKETGAGARVVRVGTHALKQGSKTKLWQRLSQHRGVAMTGGGNHRGSIFRLHVGGALLEREPDLACSSWGNGSTAPREVRQNEHGLEVRVSELIRHMPFLWLAVEDPASPDSDRGYVERNAIGLLSNLNKQPMDEPSENWLGRSSRSERIRRSGLWNSNHVDEQYDPSFLERFEQLAARSGLR